MASAYIRSKGAGYENVFQVCSCKEEAFCFYRVRFMLLDDDRDDLSCCMNLFAVIWWNTALFGTVSRWWVFQRKELCF